MATFILLGKYSAPAIQGISAARTKKGKEIVKKCGGKVTAIYGLLGKYDLLFIADFPGIEQAMKASISLSKATGIAFITFPAIPVEKFDKLMGK